MSLEVLDNYECEGQLTLWDLEIPEGLFAVSNIFARAKKEMSLPEYKAFVYTLANLKFTEENGNKVLLDKKTLAKIVGINSDTDHLSQDLWRSVGELPKHSFVDFRDKDLDIYVSGVIITSVRMYKNRVAIKIDEDYMPLFSKLESQYITMWSGDIYSMTSERSIEFYEQLRLNTNTKENISHADVGIKYFKDLFNIPKEGKGSYMREKGGFDRNNFERKVIEPLCEDLAKCKMISLVVQPNGKYYEKVKKNGRVVAYHFDWTFTSHPRVASASEVKQIQDRIDKNPQVLKVAKDILEGEKKPKKNSFNNYEQRHYTADELSELEMKLLNQNAPKPEPVPEQQPETSPEQKALEKVITSLIEEVGMETTSKLLSGLGIADIKK